MLSKQASPGTEPSPPHGRLRPPLRVETHIVVGNINDKVLAPDKTWFQKVLDAAPANPKGFDFKSDQYDTHVEKGNANIGIEYGPRSGRLHAHIRSRCVHVLARAIRRQEGVGFPHQVHANGGAGGLPNFYKDDWFGEEYQKTAVRPIRRKDALGMQWTGKGRATGSEKTARQMHVDVQKLLPQSNLKDLLQLYITKTVEALETGAVKLV
eukprot:tig00000552_g2056.t1